MDFFLYFLLSYKVLCKSSEWQLEATSQKRPDIIFLVRFFCSGWWFNSNGIVGTKLTVLRYNINMSVVLSTTGSKKLEVIQQCQHEEDLYLEILVSQSISPY